MKKVFLIFLLIIILNNGYSTEEDFHNFLTSILNDLQIIRELCVMYNVGIFKDEELQIIENDIKNILINIPIFIRKNRILFENNPILKRIIIIIDYEVNNFLNMEFVNNSSEIINKANVIIDIIISGIYIYLYENIIDNYIF
ncbi:MAG: hypothetical protein FWD47_10345 [Treponema sp.]|nr:hypothetical protein [Treponema sp.]